ncbi:MAG: hypothetical protein PHW87_12940 [Methanothrix sp.]|nr:hypothetical protein [Methanothrix sp.]
MRQQALSWEAMGRSPSRPGSPSGAQAGRDPDIGHRFRAREPRGQAHRKANE